MAETKKMGFTERFAASTAWVFNLLLPRRAAALARKEVHHIVRDPYTLGMTIGLPLMMLALFGYAISFDVRDIKIAVLDQDHSRASRELVDAFKASGFFLPEASHGDPEEDVASERVRATVVIPTGFQRSIGRGESPEVQLLLDGSDNATAGVVQGYISGLANAAWGRLQGEQARKAPSPPLKLEPRYLFNPELNSRWFVVPGLLVLIMGLVSVMMTALTVAREWEQGSMELLLSTPAKPIEIILGKVAPYVGLGLLSVGMVYVAGRVLFHVPFQGSHLLLLLGSSLFLMVALSQGLLISVAARNQQVAMQMSMMSAMLPSLLLSGFIFPVESMPLFFRMLTAILPPRWYMVIVRGLFLKGAGLGDMALPFGVLTLMCAFLIFAAVRRFKTDLEP